MNIDLIKITLNYTGLDFKYDREGVNYLIGIGFISDTFICDAFYHGHNDVILKIIEKFPKKDLTMYVFNAITSNKYNTVKLMLEKGIDVNVTRVLGHSLLNIAIKHKSKRIVRLLLDNDADINFVTSEKDHILHCVVWSRNIYIIKMLIDEGINLNKRDSDSMPALCYAINEGCVNIVKILVDNGCKLLARDNLLYWKQVSM